MQHASIPGLHVDVPHAIPFDDIALPSEPLEPPSPFEMTEPPHATRKRTTTTLRFMGAHVTIAARMRTLRDDEHERASEILAAAFHDDPMFEWLIPEPDRRVRWTRWILRTMIDVCDPIFAWDHDGKLGGLLASVPPGKWPLPFLRGVRAYAGAGLFPWPSKRLAVDGLRIQNAIGRVHPKEPHLYVAVLGVDPRHQGKGAGRALLSHALEIAATAPAPAYLETTRPRNLGYYRNFGFEVTREMEFPNGAPPLWTMTTTTASRT